MTDSIGLFYDVLKKIEEAREELERGISKSDRDAAKVIFEEMCAANLQYVDNAKTIHHLAMASLLYAQAILRQHMSAQATAQG
jgi:hypothetical protein